MSKVTIEMLNACSSFKVCSRCGENKKTVLFSKRGATGTKSWCKACDAKNYKAKKDLVAVEKPNVFKRALAWLLG